MKRLFYWLSVDLREKLLQKEDLTLDIVSKTVNAHQSVKFQSGQMSSVPNKEFGVNKMYDRPANSRNYNEVICTRCGRHGHNNFEKMQ